MGPNLERVGSLIASIRQGPYHFTSGMTAFWKGSLRWLSLNTLLLTLPHFWPRLA